MKIIHIVSLLVSFPLFLLGLDRLRNYSTLLGNMHSQMTDCLIKNNETYCAALLNQEAGLSLRDTIFILTISLAIPVFVNQLVVIFSKKNS